MICVKCYRESQANTKESAGRQIIEFNAIFIYNGMSLCLGHFNREFGV